MTIVWGVLILIWAWLGVRFADNHSDPAFMCMAVVGINAAVILMQIADLKTKIGACTP
jgi:hypothetical protein